MFVRLKIFSENQNHNQDNNMVMVVDNTFVEDVEDMLPLIEDN